MKKETVKKFLKNIIIYTILFNLVALLIVNIYHFYGKSLINQGDSFHQHVIQLTYFREMLVNFLRTGNFNLFTWNIGFGYDLYSEFAYFSFGDLFSYLSILVPTSFVDELFNFLVIVRMYFVGISFLIYCHYHKLNDVSSLLGSLMYTFSAFCVWASVTQPFFTDALIVFPLTMMGIEKIILEDKVLFYTIIVAVTFFINFYFAYMIAIIIAIYGITLAIHKYKSDKKKIIKTLGKTLIYSILGILITGIVLVPTIMSFLNSERTNVAAIAPYSNAYYRNLASNLLSAKTAGQWTFLGVSSIIMISLPWFLVNRKENYPLFITLIVFLFPLLISQIGSIMSFFNFPNNRWTFVFAFIFSYITAIFINKNKNLDKKEIVTILIFSLGYIMINCFFSGSLNIQIEIQLLIFYILLILYLFKNKIRKFSFWLMFVFMTGLLLVNNYFFNITGNGYIKNYLDDGGYDYAINTQRGKIPDYNKALNYIKKLDDDYYRIMRNPNYLEDIALIKKYNTIGHYYSITPNVYGNLNMDLNNIDYTINRGAKEFDYRTKITTLLGNKYLINYKNKAIPYGYTKIKTYKEHLVKVNR